MDRKIRFSAALRTATLAVALLVPWPSAALAQSPSPLAKVIATDHDDKAANGGDIPLSEQLSEARAQLQQTVHARDGAGESNPGAERPPLQADRQRLLDWLVDLQREKVKRMEELVELQAMAKSPADADPLVKALQGPPPYSVIQVDALRDELDGVREKLAAAEASYQANQTELQNLHAQLKARAAVARRADEPSLGTRTAAEEEQAQGERDIANLMEKIAAVEIAVTGLDQQRLSLQMVALRARVQEIQALEARVLPHQQLLPQDLAEQRQRVHEEESRLAREVQRIGRRNSQHRAERERLGGEGGAAGERAAFLEVAIKTDHAILKGLDLLRMLNSVSGDVWEKRHILLTSADPDQQLAALDSLSELRQKLADWRGMSHIRQATLQTEIRAQRVRVENLAGNSEEQRREREILNLLLRQTEMDERVELAAARMEKQVSRWLADFAEPGDVGWRGRAERVRDQAAAMLKRLWQQELFVAEDISEVDGRQVSVKYGVTVGKSIGLVVVFILGYWILAVISRLIQHQLVRWFKVSPQLASVMRRWSMIGLSLALVFLILHLARIPLSVFAFLGGALAIGVGFGAQTIIKNFISGLIVLLERKVRVGDVVELGGISGYVTAVDLRATTVRAFNGVEALIPNANFIENQVINWTYSNRQVRRELAVNIAYGTDVRHAEALFLAAAAEHASVLPEPAPEVFFEEFGDNALRMVLVYWVEFDGVKGPRRVDSDLRHDIYIRLAAAGISIPFPQREVRVSLDQPLFANATAPEPNHGP